MPWIGYALYSLLLTHTLHDCVVLLTPLLFFLCVCVCVCVCVWALFSCNCIIGYPHFTPGLLSQLPEYVHIYMKLMVGQWLIELIYIAE
jgi:hypothetical protein